MEVQPIIIAVFAAYFLALIVIAIFGASRMRELSDYVLAGRRMSSLTSALSASSSTTSGWTMLVFPALAFSGRDHTPVDVGEHRHRRVVHLERPGEASTAVHDRGRVAHDSGFPGKAFLGQVRNAANRRRAL